MLLLCDDAADPELLQAVAAQKWNFETIVFKGVLKGLTDEVLKKYFTTLRANVNGKTTPFKLVFQVKFGLI